jgi:hypothetical protein
VSKWQDLNLSGIAAGADAREIDRKREMIAERN